MKVYFSLNERLSVFEYKTVILIKNQL